MVEGNLVVTYLMMLLAMDHRLPGQLMLKVVEIFHVVVIDLPLLRVAVEGSDNPVSLEKPC